MRALHFPHADAAVTFARQTEAFVGAAAALDELALLGPSRCYGWSVLDLVVHVRLGLQEMVVGTITSGDGPADHDAASYWTTRPDDRDVDAVPHILWLRRTASAYGRPSAALTHLRDAAAGAVAAVRAMSDGVVGFQGQRMRSGDFVATWVVELAVHQLDLGGDTDVPGAAWARATIEALADADLPTDLDDRSAVLAGLGRSDTQRLAAPFPISL
ncbi:maleylpyruvate isomerase N-terminal domain-containing protein [Cellulomonas sp. JH27-2]|uniref:maleylpyruvate isomerase N-terminal domain-containing protein n=1 Tax=Cellulomonas sp. JH27-2 TaxID=2774139 RepID=UPI00178280DB|nr:maleylpyruvate isomerase N-terminal domain-containing protein [Cellulomonas sp. JH27-2]MBD8060024.1 maleylpyruvate isomerase N-terminal domain-containing protein [Cellulomonas sp. JH27-2]